MSDVGIWLIILLISLVVWLLLVTIVDGLIAWVQADSWEDPFE